MSLSPPRLALFALALSLPQMAAAQQLAPPKDPSKALTVEVAQARLAPAALRLAATGTLEAAEVLNVAFPSGGRIQALHQDIGDRVSKGQILAELDPLQATAALRAAEAQLSAAEANLTQAEAAFERAKSLIERGATTRATLERSEQERAAAAAQLDEARAGREKMLQTLADTRILATSDGVITARNATAGQVIAAGQAVFQIAADGPREARFYLPALEGLEDSLGQEIVIRALDDENLKLKATVSEISPFVNSATGTMELRATVEDAANALSLGSPLGTELVHEGAPVISLPAASLILNGAETAVWVIDPATATVSLANVQIARFTSDTIEISDGVADGTLVAGAGAQLLYPGRAVIAVNGTEVQK